MRTLRGLRILCIFMKSLVDTIAGHAAGWNEFLGSLALFHFWFCQLLKSYSPLIIVLLIQPSVGPSSPLESDCRRRIAATITTEATAVEFTFHFVHVVEDDKSLPSSALPSPVPLSSVGPHDHNSPLRCSAANPTSALISIFHSTLFNSLRFCSRDSTRGGSSSCQMSSVLSFPLCPSASSFVHWGLCPHPRLLEWTFRRHLYRVTSRSFLSAGEAAASRQ